MSHSRRSGILLHPTSLPGPGGIGTLGAEAYRFVDFLREAGQTLWQILPLGPPNCGNSPYSCYSAFACNPLLIDLHCLVSQGDLEESDLPGSVPDGRVDFPAVTGYKLPLLKKAADRFFSAGDHSRKADFWNFCDNTFWLQDYALYMALKNHFAGEYWLSWPEKLKRRDPDACAGYSGLLGPDIGAQKYMQWQVSRQWHELKRYANHHGIRIIGDAPIFVALDSADVWCNQHLFKLDRDGKPLVVAGVPPDYFSSTGQRWGNPIYDWERLAADGFGWWLARIRNDLSLYDTVRIDHFRGFESCWEIPAGEETAVNGRWVPGPGEEFFHVLGGQLAALPIIAEDLGIITPAVERMRDAYGFPGMKILQFAFDSGPDNGYLPHNHCRNAVVYTGTHDNDTTRGWFDSIDAKMQQRVCSYLRCSPEEVVSMLVGAALASVARQAIIPVQDILELDSTARMNIPGVAGGNWGWRLAEAALTPAVAGGLRRQTEIYNRIGQQ